eukprot:518633-Rhodomonas_salina.1
MDHAEGPDLSEPHTACQQRSDLVTSRDTDQIELLDWDDGRELFSVDDVEGRAVRQAHHLESLLAILPVPTHPPPRPQHNHPPPTQHSQGDVSVSKAPTQSRELPLCGATAWACDTALCSAQVLQLLGEPGTHMLLGESSAMVMCAPALAKLVAVVHMPPPISST